ncbi:MAG: TAXI family TRAP transporter solute-binding subunit [Nitrospirae bacterium]|nr:MAG: TAXI family TRAP transporter solute-binding subunit [Nitrospirota bacterium]
MAADRTRTRVFARYRAVKRGMLALRRLAHRPIVRRFPVNTKWLVIVFLVIIPAFYVLSFLFERTHTTYYLFTGPQGGTNYILGPRLAGALNRPDRLEQFLHMNIVPDFVLRESCGSLDNIFYINQGVAQLGFAEDGLPLYFEQPPKCSLEFNQKELKGKSRGDGIRLRALMPLYKSPLHIIARKSLAISDIRDIQPHAKVYMGPEGGATSFIAELTLKHYDIAVDRQGRNLNFKQAIQEMIEGNIDVGFFLVGLNSVAMRTLSQHPEFKLLTVEHAAGLRFLYPYLEVITIPAATYKGTTRDVVTLGTKTLLVTSTDLSDHEVYEIASKLSHSIYDIIKDIPFTATKVTDSDPQKDLYYPLHEGAIRFYGHNPPFFLDPRTLAGIGTYLSVLFALYKVSSQFIRNYRVYRILQAIESAVLAFHVASDHPQTKRFEFYIRKLKFRALTLLRHQRITLDDFNRINEYIKGHAPTIWMP